MNLSGRYNAKVGFQIILIRRLLTMVVDGAIKGTGTGSSIQQARQNAAQEALAVSACPSSESAARHIHSEVAF